jgi:eukaryotic-like serine/threonine-protein kinase
MRSFFRFAAVALVLLLVAMFSALMAMRFAIHGGEVTVPKLVGLRPPEAERAVAGLGLNVAIERQYYSADVAEGKILSQIPTPGTRVRHGWQIRVAQSLGPQRVATPDVLGQSGRAADLNIRRRGLDVGSVSYLEMPGATADQVVAQSPPPNASGVSVPRISLLVTVSPQAQAFVMPSFIGQPLGSVNLALLDAGFHVGNVTVAPTPTDDASTGSISLIVPPPQPSPASIIVSQNPTAGQRVNAGATVNFEVR